MDELWGGRSDAFAEGTKSLLDIAQAALVGGGANKLNKVWQRSLVGYDRIDGFRPDVCLNLLDPNVGDRALDKGA